MCGCAITRKTARMAQTRGSTAVSLFYSKLLQLALSIKYMQLYIKRFSQNTLPDGSIKASVTLIMFRSCSDLLCLHNHASVLSQLAGRAAVASSAALAGRASQKNTDVTTWQIVWMDLMRETAVSLLQDDPPFCYYFFFSFISSSCGILINLSRLRGSMTDRTGHNMLFVVRG